LGAADRRQGSVVPPQWGAWRPSAGQAEALAEQARASAAKIDVQPPAGRPSMSPDVARSVPVRRADPGDADDATIIGWSAAEPEHFAVVFRRHAPAIQRYVIRRIGSQAADDVVAETFLAAFRQRASYRPDATDCRPWLYGIATNLIGRHWRAEFSQLRVLARTGLDPVTEPFTDAVNAAVTATGARARLAAALAGLPAEQRDALLLLAWAELSYKQVAEAMGVPLGTVQSRISRARGCLRAKLADLDPALDADTSAAGPVRAVAAAGGRTTMNELDLLATLREEVPLAGVPPAVAELVLAAIGRETAPDAPPSRAFIPGLSAAATPRPSAPGSDRRGRRHCVRLPVVVTLAIAAAVTAVLGFSLGHSVQAPGQRVVAWSGVPGILPSEPGYSVAGQGLQPSSPTSPAGRPSRRHRRHRARMSGSS
jgi:RNA polymerase sigma factor (sigma-70 family)